ncbi:hypothetical protein [Nocardia transvalensis]|uniref:hypothetical protein n=1 Tax=Nocardia transvalensis TaxID=37333 RepID=UPI0018947BB4|nr:hypothetical protein [Nocardia transvalensis]MBF6328471.1 hypothetical protein [Nocardia transvalensis]
MRAARRARKLYRQLVREDVIPQPWDLDEFRRRVDEYRGRRVQIIGQPADFWVDDAGCAGVYAMTFAVGDTDIMIVRDDGPAEWTAQCIGHEYAHLLLNHDPRGVISVEEISRLFGDDLFTDPEHIRSLLGAHKRADLSIPIEREAEAFAELLAFSPAYSPGDRRTLARMRYGLTPPPAPHQRPTD